MQLLFLGIILASVLPCQSVQPLATLFKVDTSNDANKGCGPFTSILNSWLEDSSKLAAAGVTLLQNYGNDVAATRTVDAWFRQPNANQRQNIATRFTQVQQFLDQNMPRPNKPYLWCGSKWLQRFDLSDQAFDNQGQKVFTKRKPPQPVSIDKFYKSKVQAARGTFGNQAFYPYWSKDLKEYIFDQSYGNKFFGFCSKQGYLGAVQDATIYPTMTLCFQNILAQTVRLGAVAPAPIERAAVGTGTTEQGIDKIQCGALTMFHELFHLVIGTVGTPDVTNAYEVPDIFGISSAQAVQFPETYTLAAESYWYTQNKRINNRPVEFNTGVCTYAD